MIMESKGPDPPSAECIDVDQYSSVSLCRTVYEWKHVVHRYVAVHPSPSGWKADGEIHDAVLVSDRSVRTVARTELVRSDQANEHTRCRTQERGLVVLQPGCPAARLPRFHALPPERGLSGSLCN